MERIIFFALSSIFLLVLLGCTQPQPSENLDATSNLSTTITPIGGQGTTATTENVTPLKQPPNISYSFIISDNYEQKNFSAREVVNETGIYIYFDDPLPKFGDSASVESYESSIYSVARTESHHLLVSVANRSYALSCLDYSTVSHNSRVCFAEEKVHKYLNIFGCGELGWFNTTDAAYIITSDGKYGLSGYAGKKDNYDFISMCKILASGSCGYEKKYNFRVGSSAFLPGGDILRVWRYVPGRTLCSSWAEVSLFTKEIPLENSRGIILEWNTTTKNQQLKSIFIPAGTPEYSEFVMG